MIDKVNSDDVDEFFQIVADKAKLKFEKFVNDEGTRIQYHAYTTYGMYIIDHIVKDNKISLLFKTHHVQLIKDEYFGVTNFKKAKIIANKHYYEHFIKEN